MFSSRLPARLGPNPLSQAVAGGRAAGTAVLDLTETNPTLVGLAYPSLEGVLASPDLASYRPDPLGMPVARAAVAETYARRGVSVPPDRVALTASTSEAYSFLFKLLCDTDDDVLVPQPSYPLFDLLTRLDGVRPVPYRLDPRGAWCIDRPSLEQALTPRTRAVLVVSPNNPTGSMLRADDREWLVDLARRRRFALVADEVFQEYPLGPRADATALAGEERVLTCALGGLSKAAGLPQMKLAWVAVSGPADLVSDAMTRLEIVADTYLSVSTPVQLAAARLLASGLEVRASIRERIARNLATLRAALVAQPSMSLCEPEGGWSVVIRVPAILTEEQLVLRLLREEAVLVHPGYFFDFEDEAYVILSLLPAPAVFDRGVERVIRFVTKEFR